MLLEHAVIGRSYGELGAAYDVRLVSYGLDEKDNEFIIGIVGKELHPLSKVSLTLFQIRFNSVQFSYYHAIFAMSSYV